MADFDKSTFDPKAAAEARKKEMDQMAQKLEAGVKDVFRGENYKAYLDLCAKMPRYSVNNQILSGTSLLYTGVQQKNDTMPEGNIAIYFSK